MACLPGHIPLNAQPTRMDSSPDQKRFSLASPASAQDPLLEETVNFTGAILYYSLGVPGLVIGVVRNGETAVAGFGRISDDVGRAPDGDTLMRVGSITKVFT